MSRTRFFGIFAAALLTVAGAVVPAQAQNFPGGGGAGGMRGFDPSQIRQRLLGNVQQQVGFTDDEWLVVEPKLWRVVSLQVASGSGGLGSMIGMARGFTGRGGAGRGFNINLLISQIFNNGQPSPSLQRQQELQDVLDDPGATPQAIRVKLDEYRIAVKKVKEELVQAEQDLQGVLTLRQEAALLQMGFLE